MLTHLFLPYQHTRFYHVRVPHRSYVASDPMHISFSCTSALLPCSCTCFCTSTLISCFAYLYVNTLTTLLRLHLTLFLYSNVPTSSVYLLVHSQPKSLFSYTDTHLAFTLFSAQLLLSYLFHKTILPSQHTYVFFSKLRCTHLRVVDQMVTVIFVQTGVVGVTYMLFINSIR